MTTATASTETPFTLSPIHPAPAQLESFMRRELSGLENAWVVRHLLTGCPACVSVTRRLWVLADGAPPGAEVRE